MSSDFRDECIPIYSRAGNSGARLGTSVSDTGDLDGDGTDDFVAGGPNFTETSGPLFAGTAVLYSGATGQALCTLTGSEALEFLGMSVRGIGDTNYDGLSDFAVGSPGANGSAGKVTIYTYNRSNGQCDLLYTINGTAARESFGLRLAGSDVAPNRCDMNNDGYPEFLVGTGDDTNGPDTGSYFVYSIATPTPTPTITPTPSPTPTITPTPTVTPQITALPILSPTPTKTPKPKRTKTPKPAHVNEALPKRASLTYKISPDGTLTGSVTLDRNPYNHCIVTLQGRTSDSGLGSVSQTATVISRKRSRRITYFQAAGLPKPSMDTVGKPYILHLIAKTTCENKTFSSNVASRYLTCGSMPAVSVSTFLQTLTRVTR